MQKHDLSETSRFEEKSKRRNSFPLHTFFLWSVASSICCHTTNRIQIRIGFTAFDLVNLELAGNRVTLSALLSVPVSSVTSFTFLFQASASSVKQKRFKLSATRMKWSPWQWLDMDACASGGASGKTWDISGASVMYFRLPTECARGNRRAKYACPIRSLTKPSHVWRSWKPTWRRATTAYQVPYLAWTTSIQILLILLLNIITGQIDGNFPPLFSGSMP